MEAAFEARLRRSRPFLAGLRSMREISTMAALIVREGEIELRICNGSCTSLASLVLQASTIFPLSDDVFALRFDVDALASELLKFHEELNPKKRHGALLGDEPLCIYKTHNSDEICFQIGLDSHPLCFKPQGETQLQTDLRDLQLLPVNVTLTSEWFRKLLNFFDVEQSVSVELMDEFLIWQSEEKSLRLDDPAEYSVQGSLDGRPRRLEVKFIHKKALLHASDLSKTAVVSLADKEAMDNCILFQFPIDQNSYFSLGLSSHADTTEQKEISARK